MKKFKKLDEGSAIIRFNDTQRAKQGQDPHAVTIWIGKNNVSLMIDKEE